LDARRIRKRMVGVVVSDKMDKTVTVVVNRVVKHPVYLKFIKRRSKFKAHDETNSVRMGDTVEIVQSRPLSKTKFWRVSKVISSQA
jgi:small subunit ribosomal protein S17